MKRRSLVIIFGSLLVLIVSVAVFGGLSQSQPTPTIPVSENSVTQLAADLKKSTTVPLALPSRIPVQRKFFSAIDFVSKDRYDISLNDSKDCYGVSACSFGRVSGKVASVGGSIQEEFGNVEGIESVAKSSNAEQSVQLVNGIEGIFIPYVCGANCSDSRVVWGNGGYHYSVGLRAKVVPEDQEVQVLIDMANSAIQTK